MTRTVSESFTLTHAKYLASKVTSDMWRCQQLYDRPTGDQINNYGTELAMLLRDSYVEAYEFGFQMNGKRVLSWRYQVDASGLNGGDDRPGKLPSGVEIAGASFFNQLTYSSAWFRLSQEEREKIETGLPVQRVTKDGPKDGNGYWQQDLRYSSNGISLPRSTFRPFNS